MKIQKREFLLKDISELVEYYKDELNFKIRITNYSTKLTTEKESIFLSENTTDKQVFMLYNKMKADIGGEYRKIPTGYKYFSFQGIKNFSGDCYCVDINSAYLSVLRNEGLITQNTYDWIFKKTQGKKKENRLKAVGLFAKYPVEVHYENGEPKSIEGKQDIYSWVFYTAVKKTYEAMEAVKKEMKKEFLMYWVDGIFLRANPEKAVEILEKYNFQSKIEFIENFQNIEGVVTYFKDKKEKVLFLPKDQKKEKTTFIQKIEKKL